MSVDISTLEIRIISDQVEQAEKRLRALEEQGGRSEKSTDALAGAFMRLAGPLAGIVSITEGLQKLVEVTREFDILNAGLITATGSAENAKIAFDAIQQFAASTPYDLQQVTAGFTKLVNYGLNPSERALTAYGDTASSLGKSLNDMIEAVADASTGEFERLKEFGLRASKEGDNITFTFRGMSTTVKNSSEEIQNYLIALGENNFAGAMSQRMDTLDGALSNLGDSWDALFRNISDQGVGDAITVSVQAAISALNTLNATLASGQAAGYVQALGGLFSGFSEDATRSINIVSQYLSGFLNDSGNETASFVDETLREIQRLPADFRSWIQTAVVEIVSNLQEVGSEFQALSDYVTAVFNDDTIEAASQRNLDRLRAIRQARQTSLDDIIAERDSAIQSFDAQIEKADQARQAYEKLNGAKSGGVLGQFDVGGGGASASTGGGKKPSKTKGPKGPDDDASAVENLEFELQQEEEALSASWARRYEEKSIWDAINDQAMTTTFSRKMEQWAQEEEIRHEMVAREYQENEQAFQRKQNQLAGWLNSGKITQERYNQLSLMNVQKYNQQKEQIEKAGQSRQLSNSAVFAGAALNILTTLFADSKPIAIAAALMSTYQGAANALATVPYPMNLAAAATVVASGIAQVQNIRSTNVGGGGGGGGGGGVSALPESSVGGGVISSTLPATAQTEPQTTRTLYIAHEVNGRPATDDDLVRLGNLRPIIEALNEEIKMGNVRLVV